MAWQYDQPLDVMLSLPLDQLIAIKRLWGWLDQMRDDALKKSSGPMTTQPAWRRH